MSLLTGVFDPPRACCRRCGATDRGLPIGSYVGEDGKPHKLGSRITEAAGSAGGNFLTAEIAHIARREVAYREIGALIDQERLTTNLLSSMPLTFNLLAPLAAKRERADSMLYALLSDFRGFALETLFEHSPGRGDQRFTGRLYRLRRIDPL